MSGTVSDYVDAVYSAVKENHLRAQVQVLPATPRIGEVMLFVDVVGGGEVSPEDWVKVVGVLLREAPIGVTVHLPQIETSITGGVQ